MSNQDHELSNHIDNLPGLNITSNASTFANISPTSNFATLTVTRRAWPHCYLTKELF